ncbi:MAG: aminoglycoside adenylyltransferase domain-containing protein [Methanothermobacter sp.]
MNTLQDEVKTVFLPEEVEIVLNEHIKVFYRNLPDLLDSFYLVGSLVLNDYHEGRSDVDFVALINRDMEADELNILEEIHKEISSKFPGKVLDGSYVTPQQIVKLEELEQVIYFDGKSVRCDHKSGNANIVTWFILKNYGLTIWGKQPEYYIPNVDVEDLIDSVRLNVNTYWVNWTENASKHLSKEIFFSLSGKGVEWGVLGISRLYYTVNEKDIISKYGAGEYMLGKIPTRFERIIREALRVRKGEDKKSYYRTPFRRRKDLLLFMNYMINQF